MYPDDLYFKIQKTGLFKGLPNIKMMTKSRIHKVKALSPKNQCDDNDSENHLSP